MAHSDSVSRHRVLGELEEAVGNLSTVRAHGDSLLVEMDSTEFLLVFDSQQELQLIQQMLLKLVGREVAILRGEGPQERLLIRTITSLKQRTRSLP